MNILLIRLRLIGDVIFTTPAIGALRRRFPDSRLTYLVEAGAAPVVSGNPHLDAVLVTARSRGPARLRDDARLAARLRRERFDTVIDFHGGPRAQFLTLATGAPVRVGYGLRGRGWVYTRCAGRPRALRPRHSVENQWDLLAALDDSFASGPDPHDDPVVMHDTPAALASAGAKLAAAGIGPEHQLIVLHVSAGNPFRRWPAEAFVETVVSLARTDPSRRIVLTSGPSDAAARERIGRAARTALGPARERVPADCPEFDLAELRGLIGRAALFVGGDSGPLHVAATTRTPIVGLYGPTLAARSAPWRDPACVTESVDAGELPCRPCAQRTCAPGDFRCLTRLPADAVVAAAERALGRVGSRAPGIPMRLRERSA